jgi:hypothetical protein
MKVNKKTKSAVHAGKRRRQRRPFPYGRVERMWEQNKTIAQIAHATGRVDKNNLKDPYHSVRNFLYRMHKGYRNGDGKIVRLSHRVSPFTLKKSRVAGLKGPVAVRKNKKAAQRAGLRLSA